VDVAIVKAVGANKRNVSAKNTQDYEGEDDADTSTITTSKRGGQNGRGFGRGAYGQGGGCTLLLGPLALLLLLLVLLITRYKRHKKKNPNQQIHRISIISKGRVGCAQSRSMNNIKNNTLAGHIAWNELDTHADTCCAGANWSLIELTGEVCNVNPFLDSYQPIQEIPVARCCTVWTNQEDSVEYLLVSNQMLWFGTQLPHSRINPNQLCAYGIEVNDDPFDSTRDFGIKNKQLLIPFDTTGTIVHFESRTPTEWEKTHLPVILITSNVWNPTKEALRPERQSHESIKMQMIRSLTSGITKRQVNSTKRDAEQYGETKIELGKISSTYNPKQLCDQLISAVNIATVYCGDIDQWNDEQKVSSMISNDRHSKATPEELARKWNIGIQTAKDTVWVTTQRGIQITIHPMTRCMRVDHLNLH
jgi:hypothetical protein